MLSIEGNFGRTLPTGSASQPNNRDSHCDLLQTENRIRETSCCSWNSCAPQLSSLSASPGFASEVEGNRGDMGGRGGEKPHRARSIRAWFAFDSWGTVNSGDDFTYHARAKDRARRSREGAAKRRGNFFSICLFFFSIRFFYFFFFLSIYIHICTYDKYFQYSSKPIMPRVKSWTGGGACPQGYPVPAFRFFQPVSFPVSFPKDDLSIHSSFFHTQILTSFSRDICLLFVRKSLMKLVGSDKRLHRHRGYFAGNRFSKVQRHIYIYIMFAWLRLIAPCSWNAQLVWLTPVFGENQLPR